MKVTRLPEVLDQIVVKKTSALLREYEYLLSELKEIESEIAEIKVGLQMSYKVIEKICNSLFSEVLGKHFKPYWRVTNFGAESTTGGLLEGLNYEDVTNVITAIRRTPIRPSFIDVITIEGNIIQYTIIGKKIQKSLYEVESEDYEEKLSTYKEMRRKSI